MPKSILSFNPLRLFKRKNTARIGVRTSAQFRYKVGYRRDGKDYWPTDWRYNLILDSGLDKIGTNLWQDCWATCLFGNQVSPDPVTRASGAVTFTTVGTACTSSAGFFVAQDVGRLIKFDDTAGQEVYIGAFISSTSVTLVTAPSPVISAKTGTIWYVNQTALQSFYASTTTYRTGGGDCGTSAAGNIATYKRTFLGAAVAGPVTLTEIGFNNSGANVNIFDRDIIVGGIALVTGDQPLAIANLIVTLHPEVSTAVGNVGTGFDSSGNMIISGFNVGDSSGAISFVNTAGLTNNSPRFMEPSAASIGDMFVMGVTFTLAAFSNGIGPNNSASAASCTAAVNQSYSNGNFYRDVLFTWNVSTGNGSIFGFGMGPVSQTIWQQKFTASFTKLNTQVLTATFRKIWQRTLVN